MPEAVEKSLLFEARVEIIIDAAQAVVEGAYKQLPPPRQKTARDLLGRAFLVPFMILTLTGCEDAGEVATPTPIRIEIPLPTETPTIVELIEPLSPQEKEEIEKKILEAVNYARKVQGLPELKENPQLELVAEDYSGLAALYYLETGETSHFAYETTPQERAEVAGYQHPIGECGFSWEGVRGILLPQITVEHWLNSKTGHREVLLSNATEIGIGVGYAAKGEKIVTTVFAEFGYPP